MAEPTPTKKEPLPSDAPQKPGDILLPTQVIEIEGIGFGYAKKLEAVGVVTLDQLRAAKPDELAARSNIPVTLITTWQSMADLMRVPEVGRQYAELLYRAGYRSVAELAGAAPNRVQEQIEFYLKSVQRPPTKEPFEPERAAAWIEQAQRLTAKLRDVLTPPASKPAAPPRPKPPPVAPAAVPLPERPPVPAPTMGTPSGPREKAPAVAPSAAKPATPPPAAAEKPAAPAARPVAPAPAPRPKTATEDVVLLNSKFPGRFTHLDDTDPKIPTVLLSDASQLLEVARFLQQERKFEHLALITAVDLKTNLELIYNFWSYSRNLPIEIKVKLPSVDPHLPSLTSLWAGADWHERENYDLMGVRFDGHPNLKRILLPEGWKGHPLRKDYEWKKEQYVALDPVSGEDIVYQEPREGAW